MIKTTQGKKTDLVPTSKKIVAVIKSWPAQSVGGIIMNEHYTVIRADKHIVEVLSVADDVTTVAPGDIAIVDAIAGSHVAAGDGHVKIYPETSILAFKHDNLMLLSPETFIPGMDYMTVKVPVPKEEVTDAGVIVPISMEIKERSKRDVATLSAEIVALGPFSDMTKRYADLEIGDEVILDSYVGLDLPNLAVSGEDIYKIVYRFDVLATVRSN